MTDAQKHAARLRDVARYADPEFKASLLAGAEALEAQGIAADEKLQKHVDLLWKIGDIRGGDARNACFAAARLMAKQGEWRIVVRGEKPYFVPAADYKQAIESPELIGSAVCADDVVITGWR